MHPPHSLSCSGAHAQVAGHGNSYLLKRRQQGADNGAASEPQDHDVTRITPKQIRDSVDASLRRLGTDYIDLLQVCVMQWVVQSLKIGLKRKFGACALA